MRQIPILISFALALIVFSANGQQKEPILHDDFDDNTNHWHIGKVYDTEAKIDLGHCFFDMKKNANTQRNAIKIGFDENESFEIETKIVLVKADADDYYHGLTWGGSFNGGVFYFLIKNGAFTIQEANGIDLKLEIIRDWTNTPSLNTGVGKVNANVLKIRQLNGAWNFYINGTPVHRMLPKPFYGNYMGFSMGKKHKIAVDYFNVSKFTSEIQKPMVEWLNPAVENMNSIEQLVEVEACINSKAIPTVQFFFNERLQSDRDFEIVKSEAGCNFRFKKAVAYSDGINTLELKVTNAGGTTSIVRRVVYNPDEEIIDEEPLAGGVSKVKRIALVIGNSNYQKGNLSNPVNDARAMKVKLETLGFKVLKYENSSYKDIKKAIDEFGKQLKHYDVGLFYYAGHGIQLNGRNYLVPIDALLENEEDVEYDCVLADRVMGKMEAANSNTNIVILDACRNNPFENSWSRNVQSNGLAFMNAPKGTFIAYATSPGRTAADGRSNSNGVYTAAILKYIGTPNLTIEEVFKKVRAEVSDVTHDQQTPWESTSLIGKFYFKK